MELVASPCTFIFARCDMHVYVKGPKGGKASTLGCHDVGVLVMLVSIADMVDGGDATTSSNAVLVLLSPRR